MTKLSGKSALVEIDDSLRRARASLAGVEQQYSHAREALAQLQYEEVGVYADLAKLRLVAIESGALLDTFGQTDRAVAQILDERQKAAAQLNETIDAANMGLADVEKRRGDQQSVVSDASNQLDAAEASAQTKLGADPNYQARLEATEHADFVADQAEDKAGAARRDRIEKGKPYEDDALFFYLWARGYGTSKYTAWPLARWLDGRVARLCDYSAARRDYALLIEIPQRLREHAQHMRAAFAKEVDELRALEQAAAELENVPILGEALTAAERQLELIDTEIAAQEDALRALVRERIQFANGSDPWYARCIDILRQTMRAQGFGLLQERAARTQGLDDDQLVQRLTAMTGEIGRIEQDLSDYKRVYERESARLHDFQDVRRRFKAERFDDSRSNFLDAALFTLVLQRLLNGAISSTDAWKSIRRQQRTRSAHSDPRFGTRRFPRAPRSGPWRMPRGGGGFGGGGFGSGGGFGGGGFKSGGGF